MNKIIKRFIDKFYEAPRRFAGGPLFNLFGYHVLRVLFFNLALHSRRKRMPQNEQNKIVFKQLLDDGIVVISDFFPEDVFQKIKEECDNLDIQVVNERAPHIRRTTFVRDDRHNWAPVLEEHLANNPVINDIASALFRKDILITPKVAVEKSFFHKENLGRKTTDVQSDNLHFDVSYPTLICFLYLNDIDQRNAAFTYVKGSHKLTWARLWMEYKMSLAFYWRWDKKRRENETPEVSDEFVGRQGLKRTQFAGKRNTLVMANTMGFHSRGKYLTTMPREIAYTTFRELESLKYWKRKLFSRA